MVSVADGNRGVGGEETFGRTMWLGRETGHNNFPFFYRSSPAS
jgi:hypothetical protein